MNSLIPIALVTLRFVIVGLCIIGTSFLTTHFITAYRKHHYKRFIVMGCISGIIGFVTVYFAWFHGLPI